MNLKLNKIVTAIIFISLSAFCMGTISARDFIFDAMRDEIGRTMRDLSVESLQKPYFVEYTLKINRNHHIKASLGSIVDSLNSIYASLTVGIRVGSYKFDNTNFFDFGLNFFGSGDDEEVFRNRIIPLELDYNTLRHELWLATDAAYKQAAEIYSKKEAALKNKIRKDTINDFLLAGQNISVDTTGIPGFDMKKWEESIKFISSVFLDYPEIQVSSVNLEFLPSTIYYLNSEGTEYVKTELFTGFEAVAVSQADDGMPLAEHFTSYSFTPDELPSVDSLRKAVKILCKNIIELRDAPTLDESYSGPVLFEGQAASEIFAQVFAPNLVAQRAPLTEQGTQTDDRYSTFQTKIGGRVLPEFLSVYDLPTRKKLSGTNLSGSFEIDDDGIPPQELTLVKNGFLKTLLSSRIPTKRIRQSNGHKRGGAAMLSVEEVVSDKKHAKDRKALISQMTKLYKDRELPFGIVVKELMNQNIMFTGIYRMMPGDAFEASPRSQIIPILRAYKVYPDGREELIRGITAKGFSPQSFKDILSVGKKPYILNYLAPSVASSFITGGSAYVASTVITPDLLFEDGEIKPLEGDFPKLPIVKSPLSAGK